MRRRGAWEHENPLLFMSSFHKISNNQQADFFRIFNGFISETQVPGGIKKIYFAWTSPPGWRVSDLKNPPSEDLPG
jgi:hypothetical protein